MSKSTTPPYRLEMSGTTNMSWYVKSHHGIVGHGRPTEANLRKYILAYVNSLKIGGTNQHISKALGYIPYPTWAMVVRQSDGKVMCEWKAAMFEVWD